MISDPQASDTDDSCHISKEGYRSLGDAVKVYESADTKRRLAPGQPILVRLDGRAFHTLTKQVCTRPFDIGFRNLMTHTACLLAEESGATLAYTQSDEISLVLPPIVPDGNQGYFGGRVQKIQSCLAARAAVAFNLLMPEIAPHMVKKRYILDLPVFDCRVWTVPTRKDAVDAILWREIDARVNSVSQVAHAFFSANALHGLSTQECKAKLLEEKDIRFADYDVRLRRGVYIQRKTVQRKYTAEELESLPPKHAARFNPDLMITRSQLHYLDMPPLQHVLNAEEVLFDGADPVTAYTTSPSKVSEGE
jgi:tRNA(His) 5'-end guanylyltransferase